MRTRALALAVLLYALPARAHGLDANRVEVVLHEGIAEAVATPPAEFFRGADRDGDGLLSVREVQARQEEVLGALRGALRITDEDGRAGTLERDDVSVPIGDGPGPQGVRALHRAAALAAGAARAAGCAAGSWASTR